MLQSALLRSLYALSYRNTGVEPRRTTVARPDAPAPATSADARREALGWLATRLAWERYLDELRDTEAPPHAA
jgi:hypothetical protein